MSIFHARPDTDDAETIYPFRDSTRWLLKDQLPRMGLWFGFFGIAFAGWTFFYINHFTNGEFQPLDGGTVLLFIVTVGFAAVLVILGWSWVSGHESIEGLTKNGVRIFDPEMSKMTSGFYRTISYQDIIDIDFKVHATYHQLVIEYRDEFGLTQEETLSNPVTSIDVYGLLEALDELNPGGPHPSVESARETVKKGLEPPKSVWRDSSIHGKRVERTLFGLYLVLLGIPFLYLMYFQTPEEDLTLGTSGIFIEAALLYICICMLMIIEFGEWAQTYLDRFLHGFRAGDDGFKVPRPLMLRMILNIRPTMSIDEISEVRMHMLLDPSCHMAVLETTRGNDILVAEKVMTDLSKKGGFKRSGRRLVRLGLASAETRPIATWSWPKVIFILSIPVLLYIGVWASGILQL